MQYPVKREHLAIVLGLVLVFTLRAANLFGYVDRRGFIALGSSLIVFVTAAVLLANRTRK